MDENEVLSIITDEMGQSLGGDSSNVTDDRETALKYYLGQLPAPPEDETRSGIVSTDVADAIEWIKPEVIKSFVQNNEVVAFDPIMDGDEDQADLETDYVYGVLMKENEGFIAIHSLVNDCLLQKNGLIKVFYDDEKDVKTEQYTGLSKEQLEMLVADPEVEIMTMTGEALVQSEGPPAQMPLEEAEQAVKQAQVQAQKQLQPLQQKIQHIQQQGKSQQMDPRMGQQMQQQAQQTQQQIQQIIQKVPKIVEVSIDVKISRTKDKGKVTVIPVPPEEFRISSRHNSVNPGTAPFTSHNFTRKRGELVKSYPDKRDVIEQMSASYADYEDSYRFDEMGEEGVENSTSDKTQDDIDVFESYLTIDIEDDGIGKMMQVVSIGIEETPTYIMEQNEVEENPFISGTAILMSHKFLGLSFYDRLKDIQDEKTTLWRSMNNNLALINNKEYEVVEGKVNLDDLMVSRPGGIKRVKAPGMLREIITSPLPPDAYKMFEYLDIVRTGRAGVSPESAGQEQMIGSDTAHGIERLMTKREELVGLVVRVMAETAIKPLVVRIRDLLIRNVDMERNHKFRGQWKKLNPSRWQERTMVTVRVGTGTGSADKQVGMLTRLGDTQAMIKQDPGQALVNEVKIFSLLDDLAKAGGLTGAREYFVDPSSPEGQKEKEQVQKRQAEAKQKQDEVDKAFAQSQMELAKAENLKAQADLQTVMVKAQSEKVKAENEQLKMQINKQKQDSDAELTYQDQIASLQSERMKNELQAVKLELDAAKIAGDQQSKVDELEFKFQELSAKMRLEYEKLDLQESIAENANESNETEEDTQ